MGRLKYHPDFGGTHLLAALINAAVQTLSDPQKRAEYDRLLFWKQSKKTVSSGSPEDRSNSVGDRSIDEWSSQTQPSPNDLKQDGMFRGKECRDANRIEKRGALSYSFHRVGHRYHGELINLSPNGVRFISEEQIERFANIEVQTPLLSGTATVKHCNEARRDYSRVYLVGVCFKTVDFYQPRGNFLDRIA
jgi:curved DNA-binding protein CbpA